MEILSRTLLLQCFKENWIPSHPLRSLSAKQPGCSAQLTPQARTLEESCHLSPRNNHLSPVTENILQIGFQAQKKRNANLKAKADMGVHQLMDTDIPVDLFRACCRTSSSLTPSSLGIWKRWEWSSVEIFDTHKVFYERTGLWMSTHTSIFVNQCVCNQEHINHQYWAWITSCNILLQATVL